MKYKKCYRKIIVALLKACIYMLIFHIELIYQQLVVH